MSGQTARILQLQRRLLQRFGKVLPFVVVFGAYALQ